MGADGRRKQVSAPETIGRADEAGAWEWLRKEVSKRDTVAPAPVVEASAAWVCEHYLAWAEKHRDDGRLPKTEYRNKARHLGIFAAVLGSRAVESLTPDELTAFGETLLEVYSATYARNVCATARAAFNWAARPVSGRTPPQLIAGNPIRGYTAPTIPRSPERFAQRAEAAAFVGFWRSQARRDTIRGRYDRLTLLLERILIRTGPRPKELCGLQWADIQWDGWTTSSGHVAAKAIIPPSRWKAGRKTGKPRTILLTPALTRALRRIFERGAPDATWVFVKGGGRGGRGLGEPWPSGSSLSKTTLKVRRRLIAEQEVVRERIKAGEEVIPWERRRAAVQVRDEGDNRLVNYRWRHTAIWTMLMLGVDVSTAAELTGTSPDMIYRHYGHILSGHLERAAETLLSGRVRSGPRPAGTPQSRPAVR